jgi:predicted GNAT family acetyltransferase
MTTRDAGSLQQCGPGTVEVLSSRDFPAALELLDRDPVQNLFIASRLHAAHLDSWRLGAELWGYRVGTQLQALCYAGANLVPTEAPEEVIAAFAAHARQWGKRCSSLVGPAAAVSSLWRLLEPGWGPARDVRPFQPVMVLDRPPLVEPDPLVRLVRPDEVDVLLPAAVAMFTEEVGISPVGADGGALYRARVSELVHAGQAFARIEDGRVIFKAEVGAATPLAAQIQGVWVAPDRRGEGLSVAGMAAVVEQTLTMIAPLVTLYVNDYNVAARSAYRHVGFRDVGAAMTVLL